MTYSTPDGYRDAVYADDRTVEIYLSIGSGIDTTAADDITSITGSFLPMSNSAQVTDAIYALTEGLATFEGDGIPLDGSAIVPPGSAQDYPPETGLWSSAISDASGAISFEVAVTLSRIHRSALRIYTGIKVLSATATFWQGSTGATEMFASHDDYIEISDVMTYDRITISISSIDGAYKHARLVEMEFGASKAISRTDLAGEVTLIRELDPTELTIPVDELDFSLINVEGDFDVDRPGTRLDEVRVGYPVWLSYTVSAGATRRTIPCGEFWIGQIESSDTRVDLVAFDARHTLADTTTAWSISLGASVGEAIDDLLTSLGIPHSVGDDAMAVLSDADVEFGTDSTASDDLLQVQQAYGIYLIPDRQGSLQVTTQWPTGGYGTVPLGSLYSWPSPTHGPSYNCISVAYLGGVAETDLRTDESTVKNPLQVQNNPLILTQARAEAVRDRLAARISSEMVEAEWRGDPAMDPGDAVQIPGKWTQEAPASCTATYLETIFDGTYSAIVRGSR